MHPPILIVCRHGNSRQQVLAALPCKQQPYVHLDVEPNDVDLDRRHLMCFTQHGTLPVFSLHHFNLVLLEVFKDSPVTMFHDNVAILTEGRLRMHYTLDVVLEMLTLLPELVLDFFGKKVTVHPKGCQLHPYPDGGIKPGLRIAGGNFLEFDPSEASMVIYEEGGFPQARTVTSLNLIKMALLRAGTLPGYQIYDKYIELLNTRSDCIFEVTTVLDELPTGSTEPKQKE